jgi:hypothetical protein
MHHREIEGQFDSVLGEGAKIDEPENWWRRADKGVVTFTLVSKNSARQERAERKKGGEVPVLPFGTSQDWWGECQAWIAWREEWKSVRGIEFAFMNAGFTVFFGPTDDKRQIFRAEWAEPPEHGGDFGQPHWHADFEEEFDRGYAVDDRILGMDASRAFGINLGGCHLAMAGWQCQQFADKPWQSCVGDDLDRLSIWAGLTIDYLAAQLRECRQIG